MTLNDQSAEWLLNRRFADEDRRPTLDYLGKVRNAVLENARITQNETVLDVGCGDGLIGFGALNNGAGQVVFADISQDLLDTCEAAADDLAVGSRCRFVLAPANDLAVVDDESVDVVTTRSVLIYVSEKEQALSEFYRVLRTGGRISLFEPINSVGQPSPPSWLWGYDLSGLETLVARVRAVSERLQPLDSDPMLNFDERDLVDFAERVGFTTISLQFRIEVQPRDPRSWESFMRILPNPKVPSFGEIIDQVLQPAEREQLVARLRPLVEQGLGRLKSATAYLQATKR